ncbi:MAG: Ig-like domain-containing protein [Prevotella sp.]|nr:Ig-like domain-containing protein [Prevotella sp.]
MFKQLHYFKSWLLLMLCMVVGVGSTSAQDVTYDIANDFSVSNGVLTDGTVSFSGSGPDNFKMNTGYFMLGKSGAYINFPIYSSPVEKIVVTGRSGASSSTKMNVFVGENAVSTQTTGSTGTNTYEIASDYQAAGTQYTLKVTSAHNAQITKIEVYYKTSDPSDTRTATSITIDDSGITNTDLYEGTAAGTLSATVLADETAIDGASVTWSSETESVATIAADGTVTLVGAGSTVITASYDGDETNYKPSTATYTLTVTNEDPNAPGTENNPYTVTDALAATAAEGVYVQGTISSISEVSTQYKNATYTISDGTSEMTIYRGRYLDNADFTSEDQIAVGDIVTVYGNLQTSSNVNRMASGNYIVSLTTKPTPTITFQNGEGEDITELEVSWNETAVLTATCSAGEVELTYSSEDATIADWNGGTVSGLSEGTTNVIVSFAGNDDYKAVTATLPVTVTDTRIDVTLAFTGVPKTINLNETATYTVTATPNSTAITNNVTYSSSDDNIVLVDETTGEIAALAAGTATITATFAGNNKYKEATTSYPIKVVDPNAPSVVYEKVTSTADITDGEYLIVYAGDATHSSVAFNSALETLDAANNGVAVTITDDKIESSADVDAATFTITAVTNGYTIVSSSGKYIDKTSYANGLDAKDTEMVNSSITIDESGNVVITASGGCTMRYNYASDNLRFRYYKSGQQAIQLYKKVTTAPVSTVTVTITAAGAASFSCDKALDFSQVEGITAYKATSKSDSYVHLDEVEQVPAGAGVIVKGAEGTYQVPVATGDVAELEGNLLVGTGENTFTVTSAEYGKVFKYVKTNAGVVGFQKAKVDWTCQAGHAYLMLSEAQAREFIDIFDEDISTGIEAIDNGQLTMDNDAPVYNLAGQKVGKGYKGIVVKNGKKYVK